MPPDREPTRKSESERLFLDPVAPLTDPSDPSASLSRGDAADHRRLMQRIEAPFDESRRREWPQVIHFLDALPRDGPILDLACGNGRHTLPALRLGHRVVAIDVANGLLRRLRGRLEEEKRLARALLVEADALRLPLRRASVEAAIFVAGLHCIRGRSNRQAALLELRRVLKPEAPLQLTVWWRDPKRFRGPLRRNQALLEADETAMGENENVEAKSTAPPVEPGDVSLPWRHGIETPVDRFFHLYTEDELEEDLRLAGFAGAQIEYMRHASTWNLIATLDPEKILPKPSGARHGEA